MADLQAGEAFLDELADRIRGQVMRETLRFAATSIGARAVNAYMQSTNFQQGFLRPDRESKGGPLRILQGRLARSLIGARTQTGDVAWSGLAHAQEGVSKIAISQNSASLIYGSEVPYAIVHETGMTIQIPTTERMVRFFWAKYYAALGASMSPRQSRFRRLQRTTQALDVGGQVQVNREAQKYKALALAASDQAFFSVTIPQRAFLGPAFSDEIDDIQDFLADQVVDAFFGS